jgi:tetratricopeptide (TPR) repeat protein
MPDRAVPDHTAILLSAIALQRASRTAAAAAIYRSVLAEESEQPQALYLSGLLHLGDGRASEATELLRRASLVRPGDAGVLLALARARLNAADPEGALCAAEAALAAIQAAGGSPAQAHFLRGTALNALARPEAAVAAFHLALDCQPGMAAAHLNLANAYADLDRLEAAEGECRIALALDPGMVEAHASLGFILTSRGRLAEARAACEAAIALRPEFGEAHWNLATAALLEGDFDRGFREYEWRKRHDRFRGAYRDLPGPVWSGGPCAGATVLVMAEQGLGDTIQLSRYLPLIAARDGVPVLACDPCLIPLLETLPGLAAAVPRTGTLPRYDLWIDQMSLPRAFSTRPDTVPDADGYLTADPVRTEAWRRRLAEEGADGVGEAREGRPRVGLVWAGNPAHSNDRRRSLPYRYLARLLGTPGVAFVSLQCGTRAAEAVLHGVADRSAALTDYGETAALIANLDLVVAVDTSVAHLAGALGKPVWVMLPFAPDWRWIQGRDHTPWYNAMRLFRQPAPNARDAVVEAVARSLAAFAGG